MFFYDLKMAVNSKVFIGFLLAAVVFSYSLMRNLTVLGIANTAPFSKWSYSSFLCSLNAIILPLLLLLCTRVYDKKELRVRPLISSTQLSSFRYYLIKGSAAFATFIISALAAIAVSFAFYAFVFRFGDFGSLMLPVLFFLLPPAILIFGLGMLLGNIDERLIYVLIPAAFLLSIVKLNLPVWVDLFCGYLITNYPVKVMSMTSDGTAAFMFPEGFVLSRCLLILVGLAAFTAACLRKKN